MYIHSLVDGHFLVVMNTTTMNVCVQVFVWKILSFILIYIEEEPNQDFLTFELSNTPQRGGLCGNSHLEFSVALK